MQDLDEFYRIRDLGLPLPGTAVGRDVHPDVLSRAVCYHPHCDANEIRPFWGSWGKDVFRGFYCANHAAKHSLCWECGIESGSFNVATIYANGSDSWRPFVIRYCDYLTEDIFGSFWLDETPGSIDEALKRAHHHAGLIIDTTAVGHEAAQAQAAVLYWARSPKRVNAPKQMSLFDTGG